jgi:hypothetical protein
LLRAVITIQGELRRKKKSLILICVLSTKIMGEGGTSLKGPACGWSGREGGAVAGQTREERRRRKTGQKRGIGAEEGGTSELRLLPLLSCSLTCFLVTIGGYR